MKSYIAFLEVIMERRSGWPPIFIAEGDNNVAITLTPGYSGILKVIAGGEVIFDKDIEGTHPELTRVKEMRTEIRKKLQK